MTDVKLGKLINRHQQRDAIHIAVAPVTASCNLKPGQRVGLTSDGEADAFSSNHIGIVDPFLLRDVRQGDRFWLLLYQDTVTSLRHDWTHPAFRPAPGQTERQATSVEWLRLFADEHGRTYDEIITAGEEHWVPDDGIAVPDEFWVHYEIVTGQKPNRTEYFSCSC